MIDLAGTSLTASERVRLCHPLVGGLILFSRNYQSPEQLRALTSEIRGLRAAAGLPPILVAIDHEGGRVQRCREGFTRLPPMRTLGACWELAPELACQMAEATGYVLAAELRARGVDFSFTPVLDLDYGVSIVIGDRAFHRDPATVVALAHALIVGLSRGGMACCGKHFPGHGAVVADSHRETPIDDRPLSSMTEDLLPFRCLPLDAVMPAHVVYPRVDAQTACRSPVWHRFLREEVAFQGAVFSDDLSMNGAGQDEDLLTRAEGAYLAGCDMLLLCNAPDAADAVLAAWRHPVDTAREQRVARLQPAQPAPDWQNLQNSPVYRDAQERIAVCMAYARSTPSRAGCAE
jgi:beta-N-acetylhexosaminidase